MSLDYNPDWKKANTEPTKQTNLKAGDKVYRAIGWKDFEMTIPYMWDNEIYTIQTIIDNHAWLESERGDLYETKLTSIKPVKQNRMKKKTIINDGILLTLIIVTIALTLWSISCKIDKAKEQIGTCVVLHGQAAVVVDYNLLTSTYILSNGKTVSFEFVEQANKR